MRKNEVLLLLTSPFPGAIPTMKSLDAEKKTSATAEKEAADEKCCPEYGTTCCVDLSKVKIEPLFEEDVDFDTFSKPRSRYELPGLFSFLDCYKSGIKFHKNTEQNIAKTRNKVSQKHGTLIDGQS